MRARIVKWIEGSPSRAGYGFAKPELGNADRSDFIVNEDAVVSGIPRFGADIECDLKPSPRGRKGVNVFVLGC
jgi:hypothetical protein